jgi:hypothetical protein
MMKWQGKYQMSKVNITSNLEKRKPPSAISWAINY